MSAPPMSRPERVRQVQAGLALGLTRHQIAEILGVSPSTVSNALDDPDGSKQRARRNKYTGVCVDCGAETRSDGTSKPSPRCLPCAQAHSVVWTRERLIDAFRDFARRYGRPPTTMDWSPSNARQTANKVLDPRRKRRYMEMVDRFTRDGCWPHASRVAVRFGSFEAGLAAAGLSPNGRRARWNRDNIIERIRQFERDNGRAPTYADWGGVMPADADYPSSATVAYHFGRFAAAIMEAGFDPHPKAWPRERIIEAIQEWHREHGAAPKTRDWRQAGPGHPAYLTVLCEFGGIAQAIEAAGVPKNTTRWNRRKIALALRRWEATYGRWPTAAVLGGKAALGYPAPTTVAAHFGSYRAGIAYAKTHTFRSQVAVTPA